MDLDANFGHAYLLNDNVNMIEFNEVYFLAQHPQFDGISTMSVHSTSNRPLKIVGQDECVFMQYLLGGKSWVASNGEHALLPKSEGDGKMVSAFQSRQLGFG